MQIEKLRSLIRESVKDHIKEIEAVAEAAAMDARLAEYDKAIKTCEAKIQAAENLEEVKDLMDEGKVNELKKKLKSLTKAKEKLEKAKAKKNKGKEVTTDAETDKMDEAAIEEGPGPWSQNNNNTDDMENMNVDETYTMDEMELSDEEKEELRKKAEANDKEYNIMNESFLKMQKLAGVITEGQYRKKVQMLNEALEIEWSELGNDFTQAIQQVFGKTVKIQDAEVRYRPSSDTGKQPEFTFGVTIPSVGDKDNYKGALLYTNFLSDGNGFVGYDNYSKDKEATAEEFDKTLIPAWKKASAFVLGNLLKKPEELNKATIGGYKYEEKDLEDLKKYVASVPNLAIKKR